MRRMDRISTTSAAYEHARRGALGHLVSSPGAAVQATRTRSTFGVLAPNAYILRAPS